jgi:hypothetical protein
MSTRLKGPMSLKTSDIGQFLSVKNYTLSEIFRLIARFYRVADFLLGRPNNISSVIKSCYKNRDQVRQTRELINTVSQEVTGKHFLVK